MTDLTNPITDDPFLQATLVPQELSFLGYFQSVDKIGITGNTLGFADGTEVNVLIVDVMGNSTSATAIVVGGSFEVSDIDATRFAPGDLTLTATAGNTLTQSTLLLEELLQGDPIVIDPQPELNGLNELTILGRAPSLQANEVLTLEVRDSLGAKVTSTAVVQADGTFSVLDLSTQGLKEGVLLIDVKALTNNAAISVVNAASVLLSNMTPEGTDNTLQATEDTALVFTAADFGYVASGSNSMTGVKIAGLPALGTLKLNGAAVMLDQFVSLAQLNADQLVFQAAPNASGNNYTNFKFKVMDDRLGNNADLVANTLTINVTAVNDATVVANLIPDQVATYNAPFSYTVPANTFTDVDSTLTYSATLGSGAALPAWLSFNAATRTFSGTPPNATDFNLKVIASDGTTSVSDVFAVAIAPAVTSLAVVSATGVANTRLNEGDVATIEVNFIEAVTVTGTPQLSLNIGGTLVQANYVSGSGGTTLTFTYTVLAGQNDPNGISIDANALTLNGGTIKDAQGNNANLNTPAVADNTSFKVDTENLRTVSADGLDKNFSLADDTSDTWVVYSDGTTKGSNLYVTLAGTESLQQAQMRIDGGAWAPMTLSGNKAVYHFNTALTTGAHAFDFRTLDLAGNYSDTTTKNVSVSNWSTLPNVTTVTTGTVTVPDASTGQALLGNGSIQSFEVSKEAIGSYLNNGADNLFLQGGSTGDAGSGAVADHLKLTGDGAVLNLTDLLGGGYTVDKVQGFEFLDMRAAGKQAIVADAISLGSVSTSGWLSNANLLAGYYAMVVRGGTDDTLIINKGGEHDFTGFVAAGTSTNAGNFIADGITYDIYKNDTTKQYLLVQQGVQVSIWRPTAVGAPVNIVPLSVTAYQDVTKAITDLSVEDINDNLSSVQLTVLNGTVSVTLSGTTVSAGALNTSSVTLTGTQAQLNAALATLSYKGDAAFSGTDTLTIVSTDSTGTPLSDTDTVNITVVSSNTAPVPNPANGLVDNPLSADAATTLTITDNATGNAGNFVTAGTTVAQGLVRYTLTFNEAIDATTLTEADIKVSNGTLKAGSLVRVGTTNAWTVDVQAPATGSGATSVSLLDGAYNSATGLAGQGNSATQAYGTFGLSPLGSAPITQTNNLLTPDRAMTYLPDGGWVTLGYNNALGGQYNVNAFKFDAAGTLVQQVKLVTGTAIANPQYPAIVTLENGDLLMTYSTSNLATGLVVQRLDTDLNALGAAINPATNTTSAKTTPAITALPGGGYFVSWVSNAQDGSFGGVYGQVFDANSNKVGSEILVNTTTVSGQTAPSVDAFSDGSFIVTWSSGNASTATSTLNAQFFNANGSKKGVELTLATGDTPSDSVVRVLSDGKYVVSWKTADMVSGFGYFTKFQVYNADGTASGGLVNLTGASKQAPSIAALAGGGFAVAWAEAPVSSSFNTHVDVQVYDNTGTAVGTKYQSALATASEQNFSFPNLTALPNGGYALSYDSSGTTRTVYNQVFAAPGGSFLSGATAGATDTFIGGDSVDVITANGGADIIHAGGGDDTVILNADNITKLAAANTMMIHGGTGANTLKLAGTGSVLDLTNATIAGKVSHFSSIDLTGSGNNTLKINADAAKSLSGLSDNPLTTANEAKILVINGNAGDAVQMLDPQISGTSQWTVGATDTGADLIGNLGNRYGLVMGQSYTAYTLAGVTMYVNTTVTVTDFGTPTTAPATLVTDAQSVQTLFGTRFTDADGASVANGQFKGVVITDAGTTTEQTTMGKYQWSTNGTTWTDFAAGLTDSTSVFLTPATLIRFQAASGVAALNQHDLSARLVDLSGNTGTSALVNGQTGVNASVNGGSTAFSGTRVTLVQSSLAPADPVFSSASTATTAENVPTSTVVYDATANSDTGMTYSFVSGADASLFVINSSTGEVRFNASPNFENKLDTGLNNVYDFTVRATNSVGAFADKAVALTVTNVNEYPVNNLSATSSAAEDVSTAILGLSVSDEDGNLSTVKLTVLNGTLGVSLTGGATISAGANNTSTLTLSGTQAQINAALGTVTYKASANYNGSDSLTMLATDALGLIDSNTMDITVNPVNDAPVNTVPGGKTLNEDGSLAITGISVNDIDGNLSTVKLTVTSGAVGVTLSGGVTLSAGANNSSTLTLSGTQADINTVLATLNYQAALDFNGAATLTVLTTDSDSVTDSDTVAISVTAVNDAPTGTDATITVTEDGSRTFAAADFGFADASDSPANALSAVIITTLPLAGTLTLSGTAVTAGQSIAVASLGNLVYAPAANGNGTGYTSFGFKVKDNGGTANGGVDTSVSANTLTVSVSGVNDAPVNTVPGAQSTAEDTNKVITGLSVSDADGNPSLTVTLGITNGTLTLLTGTGVTLGGNNSTSVTLTGTVNAINNLLATTNAVTYKPTPNFNGSSTLTMTSSDGTLSDSDTVNITVSPANDAPVITDTDLNLATVDPVTGNPVGAVGSLVSSFMGGVSDVDAGAVKGMAITGVDTSQGTLWFSINGGSTWTEVTQTLSNTNALLIGSDADNRLYFKPVAGAANGQVSSAISFRAWDQTSGTEGAYVSTATNGATTAFSTDMENIGQTIFHDEAPTLVGSSPSDNGYLTAVGNNLVLNFSEAVVKGTGLIQLFKADGSLVQSFDAATSTALTWSGSSLTINPTADLLANTGYYIKIAATAVKDTTGNAYAGIADATTLNFTTADASGAIVVPVNGIMAIEDLSTIGDFNGDGYDDFIVGAGMNGLSSTDGAAFVVYGNANGTVPNLSAGSIAASAGFKIVSGQTGDYFGIAVNSAGDTNGDGLADLVVTAKYGDASNRESAYVVFGKSNASTVFATGLNLGTGFTASMGYQIKIDESYWGEAVSNAGDVNGDGLSDLLVTSDFSASRNVYVIYGKTGNQSVTLTSYTQFTPDLGYNVLSGSVTDLGQSVYGAGDFNGDGLADFIVSAPNNATDGRGMVYVVYGNSTGTSVQLNATNGIAASQGFRILGDTGNNSSYSRFGFAVSSAGDVNGDGLADVMISSPYQPGVAGGAVYVVYGNSSGTVLDMDLRSSSGLLDASRGFRISSSLAGDHLGPYGKDIASAGDINGDGLSDMIISGRDDNGNTTASTYVVYGNASGTNVAIDASGNIAASNGFKLKGAVGFAVASAGDINGDGLNDLLVSARLSGISGSYNVVLGGTQWVTAAMDGAGTFAGTSGSEALIGSTGNDTITGGGGVDRFFAGKGDDTIVLTASDIANLQNNSTGQTAKTTVSGGTGFDTIRLSGGASLDLLKVSNAAAMGIDETSRIEGIERIDMATDTAANVLRISNKDVNDMAGFNQIHTGSASADGKTWTNVSGSALSNITSYHQMVVDGGSNDTVALTANGGAWANVGTVNNGSANYTVYQNNVSHSQVLVQQGVTVDTQAPTLLWSTPADNDYVNTANLGNNITLQFSEAVVKGNGFIQLWNKTTGQPVEAFDVNNSTLVSGWGTSTLTINPTANLAAATDYFIKISDNAIQDSAGLAYSGMNSDLQLNFSTQSADNSYAVPSSFTSASSTSSYLRSVATAGDFNGDGYDDLLVGVAGSNESGVYVIYGNALGEGLNLDKDPVMSNGVIAADQGFKIHGADYFGTSVSGIGDINGDGFADVLIGASSDSQGGTNAGAAFVVYGSADPAALNLSSGTIAAARGFKITAGSGYSTMGDSVSGVGDVNGDGIGDFAIGYAGDNAAYVVFGKTNATSMTLGTDGSIAPADGIRLTGAANSNAGFSVSGAGDVNGDGLADVIVSANGALSNGDGAAYVIFGGATGGDMNALVTAGKGFKVTGLTNSTGYHLGTSVSSAGDVNGDGYADLIVGTDADQNYTAAYVVYGGSAPTSVSLAASTIAATQGFRILGNTANGAGLSQVSGAGDLNGDGFADVIVGSTNGSSYVVYGKATGAEVSVSTGTIAASQGFKLTYSTNITSTTAQDVSFAGDFDGDGLNDLVIAEDTNFGNSQTYKIVFGGTQWLTTPVIGNGDVTGTAASEAILGSTANDTLSGGGGVDRFFAGMGNDTIVLTASDVTNLGNVAAGQTAKTSVNGGGGFDTLRMSGGAALNLTAITNAGAMGLEENSRIESIERIDLATDTAANTLTLTTADVKDMAGFNLFHTGSPSADGKTWTNVSGQALKATTQFHQMLVDGGSNDTLALNAPMGPWAVVGTVSDGASTYTVYQNASTASQVLVKSGVVVQAMGGPALLSSMPNDNGYLMALTDNLTLSFDQAVVQGTGTIELRLSSTGALVQSFDVATSTEVTGWASNTLTINPTTNLVGNTGYYLTITPSAIKNAAGSSFAGLNNSTDLNFTTVNSTGSIVMPTIAGQTSSYLGMSMSEVGDFNGDGYDDMIIGAHGTGNYSGAAYVVYGNATATMPNLSSGTIAASAGFKITGGTFSELGQSVSGVGDINGDGLMDVIVGTRRYSTSSSTNNIAHVVYGSTNATGINLSNGTIASSLGFTLKGGDTGTDAFFGEHVSNAGDVNGDGLADLIVSRNSADATGIGQVYVVYGKTGNAGFDFSGQTIASSDGYRITGSSDARGFGDTVSGGADVNGDGLADMIVSAPSEQNTAPPTGAAYVIFGNSTGTSYQISGTTMPSTMGFKITAEINSSLSSVDMVGDVNGDGLADVIVGTFTSGTNSNLGAAYVVYGKTSGTAVDLTNVATTPSLGFKIAANTSEYLGYKVSGAGDVNGDGLMDLMVSGGAGFTNAVYVLYGSANGSSLTVGTSGTSIASSRGFLITGYVGNAVSAAGDINGDGLDDLIMGGPSNVAAGGYNVLLGGTQWVTSVVKGEGTVTGGATAEALLGSTGNDTLTGGGGVDRFFAGMGDDTIVLGVSDVTNLANNATGQTAKAVVDGGNGFDTVRMSGGANLDLTTITNSGVLGLKENSRIESIERIVMGADAAANTLTLTARDVKDMAGFNVIHTGTASDDGNVWTNVTGTALSAITKYHQLVVFGDTNDTVVFAPDTGGWTNVGTVSNGATSFIVYQNDANLTQVLVKANALVTNNDPNVAPVFSSTSATAVAGLLPVLSSSPTWYRDVTYGTTNLGSVSTTISSTGGPTPNFVSYTSNGSSYMLIGDSNVTETLNVSFATPVYSMKLEFAALSLSAGGEEKLSLKINGVDLTLDPANLSSLTFANSTVAAQAGITGNFIIGNGVSAGGIYAINALTPINSFAVTSNFISGIPAGVGVAVSISSASPQASGGVAISSLMPAATDADGSVVGYAITSAATETGADTTPGYWEYLNGSTWTSLASASVSQAVYLTASTKVRWNDNDSGYTALSAVAVDNSAAATLGQTLNVTTRGGATGFSSGIATLATTVAPVVLDLNRDGDLSYSQTLMDVNNDGQLDQTAWAAAQDGVLVWDKYMDGAVHDNSQYAFAQYAGFAGATDLQGLAEGFDSNGDGLFSNLDALYSQFAVWQDMDQDGMSDAGEVRSLADWGIAAINLSSDGVVQAPAVGVQEAGRSTAQMADGSEMVVADAAFAYEAVPLLDLAGFVAQAQTDTKAQPLPVQASVKLFLYDMIQGVTAAEQGSAELFAAEGNAQRAPEPQHLGYHMDLLGEHLLQQPQS